VTGWGWHTLDGLITITLGVLILRNWLASGLWVIALFLGIDLIFYGLTWIAIALGVRAPEGAPVVGEPNASFQMPEPVRCPLVFGSAGRFSPRRYLGKQKNMSFHCQKQNAVLHQFVAWIESGGANGCDEKRRKGFCDVLNTT
jgi:hypothetical protein